MALQRTYDDTAILDEFILEVENEGRLRFGPGAEGVRPAEPQDAAPDLVLPPLDAARLLSGRTARWCPARRPFPPGCCAAVGLPLGGRHLNGAEESRLCLQSGRGPFSGRALEKKQPAFLRM